MAEQIYYEDVEIGTAITSLSKVATTQMLVRWAGAIGDYNPLHYDKEFARSQDIEEPIVHGSLKKAWLIQMMSDWIGEGGELRRFSCQYRGVDYPRKMKTIFEPENGDTWWCKGIVTGKYEEEEKLYVECQIWVENGDGEKTTQGSALVLLPSRNKQ